MCLLDMKCSNYCYHLQRLQSSSRSIVTVTLIMISRMLDSLRIFPANNRHKISFQARNDTLEKGIIAKDHLFLMNHYAVGLESDWKKRKL